MTAYYLSNQAGPLWYGRKIRLATVLMLFMLLAIPLAATGKNLRLQNKALPVFDINKTEYDFGDRFIGEELAAHFTVRNLGAAPLLLSETPVIPGAPTIGLYREPSPGASGNLSDRARPAATLKSASPYT